MRRVQKALVEPYQSLRDRAAVYRQHLVAAMLGLLREEFTECSVCLNSTNMKEVTQLPDGHQPRVVLSCVPSWMCNGIKKKAQQPPDM